MPHHEADLFQVIDVGGQHPGAVPAELATKFLQRERALRKGVDDLPGDAVAPLEEIVHQLVVLIEQESPAREAEPANVLLG